MATEKQIKTFQKVVNEHKAVSTAMVEAGYSENSAVNPSAVTESKGWKELMDKYLPDDELVKKHKELLNKVDKDGDIDVGAVSKALDMAYKLKGKNAPEKSISINIDTNIPEEELLLAQQLLERRRKTISGQSNGALPESLDREAQD